MAVSTDNMPPQNFVKAKKLILLGTNSNQTNFWSLEHALSLLMTTANETDMALSTDNTPPKISPEHKTRIAGYKFNSYHFFVFRTRSITTNDNFNWDKYGCFHWRLPTPKICQCKKLIFLSTNSNQTNFLSRICTARYQEIFNFSILLDEKEVVFSVENLKCVQI